LLGSQLWDAIPAAAGPTEQQQQQQQSQQQVMIGTVKLVFSNLADASEVAMNFEPTVVKRYLWRWG